MRVSNTVDIKAAPETVFYWLSHPGRAMEWMTSVSKTEILQETPGMVGTTFREIIADPGGSTEMRGVITGYELNKKISFQLDGDYNTVDVEYLLTQRGDTTRLTQNADIEFKSVFKIINLLLWPVFKAKVSSQSQREFAKLKELCERQ